MARTPGLRSLCVAGSSRARAILGLCALACLGSGGCDPYSEARAGLDAAERDRFARGRRAATPCASCHDLKGQAPKVGPPLQGLFGRRAGGVEGFPYSVALAESSVVWNDRTLDAFLANPQALIPRNRMLSPPQPDARMRSDLIFFLRTIDRQGSRTGSE